MLSFDINSFIPQTQTTLALGKRTSPPWSQILAWDLRTWTRFLLIVALTTFLIDAWQCAQTASGLGLKSGVYMWGVSNPDPNKSYQFLHDGMFSVEPRLHDAFSLCHHRNMYFVLSTFQFKSERFNSGAAVWSSGALRSLGYSVTRLN